MPDEEDLTFWEKYVKPPLDLTLRNPKLTPIFLFTLAVVPLVTLALIMGLMVLFE